MRKFLFWFSLFFSVLARPLLASELEHYPVDRLYKRAAARACPARLMHDLQDLGDDPTPLLVLDKAGSKTKVNNRRGAERAAVVCQRKISGGTRSPAGTRTFCTLATLFGTWRARGLDSLLACRDLLLAQAAASV